MNMENPYEMLKGVRVIDLTNFNAGPGTARILGDWGADVIKVEPPPVGDVVRIHTPLPGMISRPDCMMGFELTNCNKRSIVIDMKTPEGKEIMDGLLATANVFISNNRPQALRKMGLDYETMSAKYPNIVWAQLSGYGETGPLADAPGYDTVAFWALSGAMISFTEKDTAPLVPPIAFGDQSAACTLSGAICAALYKQQMTGKGSKVVLSLYGQALWNMGLIFASVQQGQDKYPKSRLQTNPLNNTYKCKDGEWILITGIEYERYYPMLLKVFGREELAGEAKFNTWAAGMENSRELIQIFSDEVAKFNRDDLDKALTIADFPHASVNNVADIINSEQAKANEFFRPYTHRDGTSMYEMAPPVQFGGPHAGPRTNAPLLGEQTSELMKEIGYSDEKIQEYMAKGIVIEHKDVNY